jgi:hypothetical protein
MLLCLRSRLLAGDFTTNLKLLQHYPAVDFNHLLKVADNLKNWTVESLLVRGVQVHDSGTCDWRSRTILTRVQLAMMRFTHIATLGAIPPWRWVFLFGHLQMVLLPLKKFGHGDRSCWETSWLVAFRCSIDLHRFPRLGQSASCWPSQYRDQIREVDKQMDFFRLFILIDWLGDGLLPCPQRSSCLHEANFHTDGSALGGSSLDQCTVSGCSLQACFVYWAILLSYRSNLVISVLSSGE